MMVAGAPLEAPEHCRGRSSVHACYRPLCVTLTTSFASSGRALPCRRACRYVAGGAAWLGGLLGRLRANKPVHGARRGFPWSL
eukprot:scaffold59749_cov73-Phaeocystis_antarctica.AAC.5